ncbi:Phosphotyrosyl phosphatase activator [Piptocephalis cylindrospora]|uniref:Serine/threonine-protein phosphatase 2A activator n=1 Tax=Piptocephalis cylindrospora TaxID=1907219 RepID=A0A4V1IXU7_9FUNG|nr:Phosphotyrosyl phosphatase activator [Piptocephalis cylindrospora]|eukprot:RKP12299.1 Phosphotyrosyl phosphatase activator [Piptocephalis cylindrospora]
MTMIPERKILTPRDLELFKESSAYADYIGFVERLNDAVINIRTRETVKESDLTKALVAMLKTLQHWVKEIPAVENAQSRFGNPAFRDFYDRVQENQDSLLTPLGLSQEEREEVGAYLMGSLGDRQRIDYGTGHEAAFMAFLLCLEKLGKLDHTDHPAMVLRIFYGYIDLMRQLQFTYWLEPAGSHGVWGLDDYHFLPFLFGSAQLRDHKYIRPKAIHDKELVEEYADDYMYLACIRFINGVKTESLRWHSPMLDDISGVKSWVKVNSGMIKMYKAEVLSKLPIMQHFLFGSLIAFQGESRPEDLQEAEEECGHVHAMGKEAPICCGIKIPSAIGASQAAGSGVSSGPRRIPFD